MHPPKYAVLFLSDLYVVIEDMDLDGHQSITNNPQAVINSLIATGIDVNTVRLIYKDTMGYFDGLRVDNGKFSDYVALRETTLHQAIKAYQLIN